MADQVTPHLAFRTRRRIIDGINLPIASSDTSPSSMHREAARGSDAATPSIAGDAFQARATHAPHRAVFHRLGLLVGIAIAGCTPSQFGARCEEQQARWIADDAACQAKLSTAIRNPGGTWNSDARAACLDAAFYTSYAACDELASGMSASGQDPQGLEAMMNARGAR